MAVYPTSLRLNPPLNLLAHHPALQRLASSLERSYASNKLVTDEMLQEMGTALWQALDQDDALNKAIDRSGNQILPIVISSNDSAIQHLPWETLYHGDGQGFLGRDEQFTLSRCLNNDGAEFPDLKTGPLRVLLFTSLPDDENTNTSRLNVEEEQAQVQEALMPWIAEGKIVLEMPDDGRFKSFKRLLADFRPQLVFLSGHGKFHHQPHADEEAYGIFLFEDDYGRGRAVKDKALAKALCGSSVECMVLSACESGKAASTSLTAGLARTLALQGLPHVIGMRESLLDRAGIMLARSFCDTIAHGDRVDLALQQGRRAISLPLKDSTWRDNDSSGITKLSLGQWCLPMLFSNNPGRPLIDWNFTPEAQAAAPVNKSLADLSLPPRFIGRRSELRSLKSRLRKKQLGQLLLTGPGGQGKTALAGKLAQDLQAQGYALLVYQAGPTGNLIRFNVQARRLLDINDLQKYQILAKDLESEQEKLELLLQYLIEGTGNKLLLLFDNLESIQDEDSLALNDQGVQDWIAAAQQYAGKGLVLLLTSRYRLPDWPKDDHWSLEHANYGDFLAMARQLGLPPSFFVDRDRLRRVHEVLHGNGRGLAFFAAAVASMDTREEDNFLTALSQAKAETQADMSLELLIKRLTPLETTLLQRLTAYPVFVPMEGLIKLGLDLDEPEQLIKGLCNRSLLEQRLNPDLLTREYQCPSLVSDWLHTKSDPPAQSFYSLAADYLLYLFHNGQNRYLDHAIVCHQALLDADKQQQADRFALDYIVGHLSRAGLFQTLLDKWLPKICQSKDKQTRAMALGLTGKQYLHLSDYDTALSYLQKSLIIQQEIGAKSGEGATLNNISSICQARGDYDTALSYLQKSLIIQQEIGAKSGEGATLNNISSICQARGDYDTALSYLQKSLEIVQEIGDKSGEGATLNNISLIHHARGDCDTALSYLQKSLEIVQEIGDKIGEGATFNNISQIFKARGDYDTALSYLQKSLAIRQEIGDKSGEGSTLNNISQIFKDRGDNDTALLYLQKSLAIRQEIGDKSGEGSTLNNISTIYHARGDYDTALSYLQKSLAIRQEIGDKSGEGTTLNNISSICQARGDYDTALSYLQKSLAIRQEIGDKSGEGSTLNNISTIYHARGDYDTALSYLQKSLAIQQEIGDAAGLCATLFNIGHIHMQKEEVQEAVGAWVQVYLLAKRLNLAQALQALEGLAGKIGLDGGLAGWQRLAEKIE